MILQRLKKIEKYMQDQSDPDEEARILREMSDEEFAKVYDKCLEELYDRYGISTEKEINDYFEAIDIWYEAGMGDEATKEFENYEKSLMRRKDRLKLVNQDRSN